MVSASIWELDYYSAGKISARKTHDVTMDLIISDHNVFHALLRLVQKKRTTKDFMTATEHTKTPNHFGKKHFTRGRQGNMDAFNWAV